MSVCVYRCELCSTGRSRRGGSLRRSKTSFTSQALYGISSSLIFFIIALIYYVGTLWLVSGRYTVGEFYVVLTAVVSHLFVFPRLY